MVLSLFSSLAPLAMADDGAEAVAKWLESIRMDCYLEYVAWQSPPARDGQLPPATQGSRTLGRVCSNSLWRRLPAACRPPVL